MFAINISHTEMVSKCVPAIEAERCSELGFKLLLCDLGSVASWSFVSLHEWPATGLGSLSCWENLIVQCLRSGTELDS